MSRFSRAFRAYQKVKTLKPSRSLFDGSNEWLGTCDMGPLYPFMWREMSPGDTFHFGNEIVVRMQPLNAPILSKINLYTHYFFVPFRILWEEWEKFITGGSDGQNGGNDFGDDAIASEVEPELPRWNPTDTSIGSLWDMLGLPTGVKPTGALPYDFIRRCYNRIWNEYYRDETLQEPVAETNEKLLFRNWKKDYFTSALQSQQRGVAPSLPLVGYSAGTPTILSSDSSITSGTRNVSFTIKSDDELGFTVTPAFLQNVYLASGVGNYQPSNSFSCTFVSFDVSTRIAVFTVNSSVNSSVHLCSTVVHMEGSTSSDIKDLRVAFNIQRWMELANRGGVRYTEFLRSFFGVSPRDSRLQRPEYIGGSKMPIIVSEVLQTSSTTGEPTPQGNMAGHGIGASQTYVGSYTAVEYGVCMGLLSIMPEATYCQGVNRQLLRRTKFDFLFPQFTHLSEQAIEGAEIFATEDETENRKVWGYNEIYDELRAFPSLIVGKMRTVFNYWHLGRIFGSKPSLNSDFIKCNPSKRIFAVPDEDGFIVHVGNIIRMVRPLPKYGTPGSL